MEDIRKISLWSHPFEKEIGFIASCKSGIVWSNQAGGVACAQPEQEGVYIPIPIYHDDFYEREILENCWHQSYNEKEIQRFLNEQNLASMFRPQTRQEIDSVYWGEAWVPVVSFQGVLSIYNEEIGIQNLMGFITYANSD